MTLLWLNGALLPAAEARIDPADRGFTLGDGIFETIRADGGVPAHLPRHLARLRAGAAVLGIDIAFSDLALMDALIAVGAARAVAGPRDCGSVHPAQSALAAVAHQIAELWR